MKLPPVKENPRDDVEAVAQMTDDVIVQLEGGGCKWIGRYSHYLEEWQINGWTGSPKVAKWWPMPDATGGHDELKARSKKFFDDVMPQVGKLCIQDFANVNELGILLNGE
jgi:hypothetical protein